MSYNKYLQQKADFPLYLATAEPNQIGNLQAELPDRNNNVTQKIKKSSADLINFYEGAEVSSSRAKFIAASLLKMIAVSAFVKFIGDFAGGYGKGMNGYYNDQTDTVVIFADNIQNTDHLEKTFAHETAGHKGLQVLLGNEYTSIIDEIYSAVNQKHSADLQELAATYGQDLNTIEGQRYIIEEYLANQTDLQKLSGFKSFVQKIKLALRKVGFRAKWTDDEIITLMRRSLENVRKQRAATDNGGVRYAAALRKAGDPNNAALKNQLRSGNVPHIAGFMEWAGLKGKNLYADYEFLYGRHSQYFNSPEEAKAAVELVLAKPEQVKNKGNNLSFVGFDEVTGDIFRIEINPEITGKANHIRSIFKITAKNYNEIKLEPPRVLQPSKTALHNGRAATMTISNFMDNKSQNPEKSSENQEKMRFSIAPQVDTPAFKNWFGDSKVVDENGKPLVVYHGSGTTFWEFKTEFTGLGKNMYKKRKSTSNLFER